MESQVRGDYLSSHTGIQIDSMVRFFLTNEKDLIQLPDYIKSLESQSKILTELDKKRVPEIETLLLSTFLKEKTNNSIGENAYKYTLQVNDISLLNGQIISKSRVGIEQDVNKAMANSVIALDEPQKGYIPIYAVKNGSNIMSMGFWAGEKSKTNWYYNGLEQASLTHDGIWTTAAGNDFAEFRRGEESEAGRVVCENGDGTLSRAVKRLQPGAAVVSDTFGSAIGQNQGSIPIAVAGRVLAYPYEDKIKFKPGDAVCAGPNGTVSKMSRREIRKYPERIIGTVSELPTYETWGNDIPVNGRIWIKIK